MAVIQRRGHQVGRLVAGEAEHDPLIAGALVLVGPFRPGIDALCDFDRLAVEMIFEGQRLPVETILLVTDLAHRPADDTFDLFLRTFGPVAVLEHALAADFTGQNDALRSGHRFAGDARFGVLREEQVDDGVGNLVGDLVGMAFRNAFGGEKIVAAHWISDGSGYSDIKKALCVASLAPETTRRNQRNEDKPERP